MTLLPRKPKPHLMVLQNNGNLVVYTEYENGLWESRTRGTISISLSLSLHIYIEREIDR